MNNPASQKPWCKVSDADFDDDTDRDNTIARAKVILRSLQEGVTREGVSFFTVICYISINVVINDPGDSRSHLHGF